MAKKARLIFIVLFSLILSSGVITSGAEMVRLVNRFNVENTNVTLNVGDSFIPEITAFPENASNKDYILSSSDGSIVQIDGKRIKAVGGGKATVLISPCDGGKAKAQISVYVPMLTGAPQTSYTLNKLGNLRIPMSYYGSDFDKNVQIQVTGMNNIYVDPVLIGTNLTLNVMAMKEGKVRISIKDKTDPKATQNIDVSVTADAIPNARKIRFNGTRKGVKGFVVNLTNQTGGPVEAITIAVALYDENGKLLTARRTGFYDSCFPLHMKKNNTTEGFSLLLDKTARQLNYAYGELAVISYASEFLGEEVIIPESQWAWFSTKTQDYIRVHSAEQNYQLPQYVGNHSDMKYEMNTTIEFVPDALEGIYMNRLFAEAYGYHHAGAYITKSTMNNIQVGDLCHGHRILTRKKRFILSSAVGLF